jgi:hypothetical protein
MTELQKLEIELNSITWRIAQATTPAEREELEDTYKVRVQQLLSQIAILKTQQ